MKTIVLSILLSTFSPVSFGASDTLCPNAKTSREIEQCLSGELQKAEKVLERYLSEARRLMGDNRDALVSLEAAQSAWSTYQQADCMAVYKYFYPGSMAGLQMVGYKVQLVHQRTHDLWETYLRNSTSPLSEPKQ